LLIIHDRIKEFKAYSLAFDESTDILDMSQHVIFIHGVDGFFQVTGQILGTLSLKDQTRGEEILLDINNI